MKNNNSLNNNLPGRKWEFVIIARLLLFFFFLIIILFFVSIYWKITFSQTRKHKTKQILIFLSFTANFR